MLLELPLHMGRESCHSRPILLCVQILICRIHQLSIHFLQAWHIPLQARSRYIDVQTQTYITINGDMGVPFQARSRYFSRLAVLKLS